MTTKPDESTPRLVRCPRCRKSTRYDPENAFRPFCSAVCKDLDIIAWAEQGYRIPGKPVAQGSAGGAEGHEDEED